MKRVLFAWELGANLGHLTRDLPFARACMEAGHAVFAAVADLRGAVQVYGETDVTLLQTPLLRKSAARASHPVSHADILLHHGFGDADALAGALAGWRSIFDLVRPDLLVYNHAPTALLAARLHSIPVLLLGNAFEIPPPMSPSPAFRPWERTPVDTLKDVERLATEAINTQLARHGHAPVTSVAQLFAPYPAHIAALPELDPFGPRPDARYVGPVYGLPTAPPTPWPGQAGRRSVFAYLRPEVPNCEALLAALDELDAAALCVLPGMPKAWAARYPSLMLRDAPADFREWLPAMDLVVTYGTGTINTAALAGVPVLTAPQVIEQYLTGMAMERFGAGRVLTGRRNKAQCRALLQEMLDQPGHRRQAQVLAERHAAFDASRAVHVILRQHGML